METWVIYRIPSLTHSRVLEHVKIEPRLARDFRQAVDWVVAKIRQDGHVPVLAKPTAKGMLLTKSGDFNPLLIEPGDAIKEYKRIDKSPRGAVYVDYIGAYRIERLDYIDFWG